MTSNPKNRRAARQEASNADAPQVPIPAPVVAPTDCAKLVRELAALDTLRERRAAELPIPRVLITETPKGPSLSTDHENQKVGHALLANALGVTDNAFLSGLLIQVANASGSTGKKVDEDALNFILSVIRGVNPQDQTEALLGVQMAAVHMAMMTFSRRLAFVDNIPQQDSASNAFNKLARTFAAQIEALKRYRTGGEQRVVVQHVHVGEGGQAAVVGAVTTGGAGVAGKPGAAP